MAELQRAEYGLPPLDVESNLRGIVKSVFVTPVDGDDAEGLEDAILQEMSSELQLSRKKLKKKGQANGAKEEDNFYVVCRQILHYACAVDAAECCQLLLSPQKFPRIRADAVDDIDHRSALHVACLHNSRRCAELLLNHGANAVLKNKHLMLPLEECFLNSKFHFEWNLSTPAVEIVEKVGKKDLSILRLLESKCKDQVIGIAFKLAKGLELVPLVALLHVERSSIVSCVLKNSEEETGGTIIDFVLGKALDARAHSLSKKHKVDTEREAWPSRNIQGQKQGSDSETAEIKHRKGLWECDDINFNYGASSGGVEDGDGRSKKIPSACSIEASRNGLGTPRNVARKLLECILLFKPRLSSHSQSPFAPPLLRAAQMGDDDLVGLFLDAGAQVNESDTDGNTALHWAVRQSSPENKGSVNCKTVQKLLSAGAKVLTCNKLGATPVHTAAGHGHFEALSLLLERESAGVNAMAATKETPLHYAVKNNRFLCTLLLLKHGANRNVISVRNQKPLQLASSAEMKFLLSLEDKVIVERSVDELTSLCAGPPQLPLSQGQAFSSKEAPQTLESCYSSVTCPAPRCQSSSTEYSDWNTTMARHLQVSIPDKSQQLSKYTPAYKGVFCHFFGTSSGCGSGSKCHFAHSDDELQLGQQNLKTLALKNNGATGLQAATDGKFKTKLCIHYENMKSCPHSGNCKYAHGEAELRETSGLCGTCSSVRLCPRPSTASSLGSCCSEDGEQMNPNKVFVGGLPPYITSRDLWDFFEVEFGKVLDATVIYGTEDGTGTRSRGFGFVHFERPCDADEAVKRHFLPLQGKKVEVKRAIANGELQLGRKPIFSSEMSSWTGSGCCFQGADIGRIAEGMQSAAVFSKSQCPVPSVLVEAAQLAQDAVQDVTKPSEALPPCFPYFCPYDQGGDKYEVKEGLPFHGIGEFIYDNGYPPSRKETQIDLSVQTPLSVKDFSDTSFTWHMNVPHENPHSVVNSSPQLPLDFSPPQNTHAEHCFPENSYSSCSSLFSGVTTSTSKNSSAVDQSDDNDEELSQLLELLQVGKSSSPSGFSYNTGSLFNGGFLNSQVKVETFSGPYMATSQGKDLLVSNRDNCQGKNLLLSYQDNCYPETYGELSIQRNAKVRSSTKMRVPPGF